MRGCCRPYIFGYNLRTAIVLKIQINIANYGTRKNLAGAGELVTGSSEGLADFIALLKQRDRLSEQTAATEQTPWRSQPFIGMWKDRTDLEDSDDRAFENIIYRRGASGQLTPVLRGTALRVQTIAIAARKWGLSPSQIAAEYDLSEAMVNEALAFYSDRCQEIDASIADEQLIEKKVTTLV